MRILSSFCLARDSAKNAPLLVGTTFRTLVYSMFSQSKVVAAPPSPPRLVWTRRHDLARPPPSRGVYRASCVRLSVCHLLYLSLCNHAADVAASTAKNWSLRGRSWQRSSRERQVGFTWRPSFFVLWRRRGKGAGEGGGGPCGRNRGVAFWAVTGMLPCISSVGLPLLLSSMTVHSNSCRSQTRFSFFCNLTIPFVTWTGSLTVYHSTL